MKLLSFSQHGNDFLHALFPRLLFFDGLQAKTDGEQVGLIETLKERFGFFVFTQFFQKMDTKNLEDKNYYFELLDTMLNEK